ncbi:hypothetical protein GMES_2084 [Paraglaciecola mesophila KMM 241]|uniref:Uncharacterized protein n=1 Tax=Paraglaciecola mesophila KMM 241 TaxID=1128912 RepID=K6ZLZ5_9ALTE|nr:hypothetical protein GMES_2084 [Paraglaciecola mesophila KMM 241]
MSLGKSYTEEFESAITSGAALEGKLFSYSFITLLKYADLDFCLSHAMLLYAHGYSFHS